MAVATYVFVDLETTGLPSEEINRTKITELSMVAVKREHLLDTKAGATPRVQNKLTLCFNPCRLVQPGSTQTTGLCNDLLEHETRFNLDAYGVIISFLKVLAKPVCLIAQNGHRFDFPIIKNHLEKLHVSFPSDLLCADSLYAFFDILETNSSRTNLDEDKTKQHSDTKKKESVSEDVNNQLTMQEINETTPKHQKIVKSDVQKFIERRKLSKVRRKCLWGDNKSKPKHSYKLKNIYERVLKRSCIEAHRAENDCIMTLEVSTAMADKFVKWVDNNHCFFTEVKPMTIGIPLGE
ncbi:three prime repair exonuclease 2-like [Battus philenor]|uniref:three prime repair exonuclease 2-like n=1 Tax=Battus philenor TaxID=42288 RepID=UPI0035D0BCDB